ncbi:MULTISPECIES: hypothetical protein [Streptomyces]|uniref:Uncharacterized protein n=3 Tax=Streptomyces TaxID=1883 RepID=A0A8H9HQ68_9ACTN|nr:MULTISPECIES: hypothetical protein [Streptomyces]MDQ0293812.1 hypothetical protein [Streptomyces sp. DSM 41037]RPK89154.1 hypothetical protein EES47_12660 [Streptomyces sp. ADI98-12]WSU36209.1 hypothetical protein OG378_10595 [Streptomyces gougerotii]SUO93909.1 Uncharacterised protein [Streptomyces griseus]GFH63994.1 hypothetical protein Srut_05080 [Streptomyces rutgersensis]
MPDTASPRPAGDAPGLWRLHTRATPPRHVADLHVDGSDFPWLTAAFRPLAPYEEHRPLFVRLADLSETEEWEAFDACWSELNRTLALHTPEGVPVADFLLHVEDDDSRASFRWIDEPAEGPPA